MRCMWRSVDALLGEVGPAKEAIGAVALLPANNPMGFDAGEWNAGQRCSGETRSPPIGITMDTYSHVLPGMQAAAASLIDVALRCALKMPSENLD